MRTFAHKRKATQQTTPVKSTHAIRALSGQSRDVDSILQLQRTIGNLATRRLLQSNAEELPPGSATIASTRFGHDFSRLPIFSPSRVQAHQFDDLGSDSEPLKSGPTKCPDFVSLTAKGKDPELMFLGNRCRFRLGKCTTPRGTCGNSADSGMAFVGKVKTAAGCTGKLAFMQNVLSADRKVTLADGKKQCITVSSAHHDGGPPWKGCSVDITTAGTHVIKSDDCPGRSLIDHPKEVSMSDKFKLYLMWKENGKHGWKPIANVTWAWSGSVERKRGAKDTDECTTRYNATSKSHTDGVGSASKDRPVTSPRIKDVKPGPCAGGGKDTGVKSESTK